MDSLSFNKNKYIFTSMPNISLVSNSVDDSRSKQVSLFLEELSSYNIILKDLVNYPLNEEKRNISLNVSYYIMENEEISEKLERKKELPIKDLCKDIRINRERIEDMKDYIVAYYLILRNPNYKIIQDTLKIKLKEDSDKVKSIGVAKKNTIYKGVVIKSFKKSAYIITSIGEFVKIKTNRKVIIGQLADGKECTRLGKYKIHIAIGLMILMMIGCATVIDYRKTESIVIVETTSNIKMHVNKYGKVIYAYSPTEKGKILISSISIERENIDEAIEEIFQYAFSNEMIDTSKKTLITVSGKSLDYGALPKTNKFISENKIPIVINNSGNEQKMPEYISEE
ncbi:anti-sigma factor domain-containing protein [Clostridium butyricum]|uniref:anti-sigma factor domain-containing protein n=1 Tax=Clostridium butyricum TaxID=1492 RepID=UPI0032C103E3